MFSLLLILLFLLLIRGKHLKENIENHVLPKVPLFSMWTRGSTLIEIFDFWHRIRSGNSGATLRWLLTLSCPLTAHATKKRGADRLGAARSPRADLTGENTIGKLNRWVILKSNFEVSGLVFSCIETKFCKKILVGKLSPRSTQCTPLHRSLISKFSSNFAFFKRLPIFSQMLLFFRQIDDFSPQISKKVAGISRNPNREFNEFHFRTNLLSF